jgi:cytochrome c553
VKRLNFFILIVLMLITTACGGGGGSSSNSNNTPSTPLLVPDGARLLASQCFQCHGTAGISKTSIDSLNKETNKLESELLEMKYSTKTNDIMHLQIKGYSDAEIQAISLYFMSL